MLKLWKMANSSCILRVSYELYLRNLYGKIILQKFYNEWILKEENQQY